MVPNHALCQLSYTPINSGSPAWARSTDLLLNRQTLLPTELLGNKSGGSNWSRTSNVYPEGSDLQSEDAHAIASILPYSLVPRDRIELPIDDYKSTVIPFN